MKKLVVLVALVLSIQILSSKEYISPFSALPQQKLEMNYGDYKIIDEPINLYPSLEISVVEIVYSDFPIGIDQNYLNEKRVATVKKWGADKILNPAIEWRFVRQSECYSEKDAKELFHGAIISYKATFHIKDEVSAIKDYIYLATRPDMLSELDEKRKKRLLPTDTTVKVILDRNNWQRMLVVSDVTGSMSPHTAQLLLWLKLNSLDRKTKNFAFFNDGDSTPDDAKKIGKTGGIYCVQTSEFRDVADVAYRTMKKGNGGDGPENDIEALITAIRRCPDCENFVLIADNMAPIKDYELIKELDKPIKIVLCGSYFGINVQYLNLARDTGGSVHTIESDMIDLMDYNEGEILEIKGHRYIIKDGKFERILHS